MNFYSLLLLIVLSSIPSLFWLIFYYYYSPRFTTSRGFLIALFFLGMLSATIGVLIEKGIFQILPPSILTTFQKYFSGTPIVYKSSDVLTIFALMFFLVAPIEELLKFLMIKLALSKNPEHLNQIIDGIKFGLVTGLGFAVVENAIYFRQPFFMGDNSLLLKLFLVRLFISTLGHSLYTGIMGYYLGLARFYKLYDRHFLREGVLLAIFVHGIFNFFILVNLGYFSIAVLIIFLLLMFKWYQDRRNLENYIAEGRIKLIHPPFLSERTEFESILAKNKVTYEFIKKLNLCPFCLKRKDPQKDICSYCGGKIKREK